MGYNYTHLAGTTAADTERFVVSVDMKVGAYTLANATPTTGARKVTMTRTVVGGADTPGTVTVVGTDLSGQAVSEVMTPGAHTVEVSSVNWYKAITSITGAGWVTATGNDTIIFGESATQVVASSSGTLHAIIVNTTAAGTITITDGKGTIAVLPASVAVGHYLYDVNYSGFLRIELGAASDVTVLHSHTLPGTFSK